METSYHLTPWDEASLGVKTAEINIKDTINSSYEEIDRSISQIELELIAQGVEFCYTRVCSSDIRLRKILQEKNFYFAEISQSIFRNKVQRFEPIRLPKLKLIVAKKEDDMKAIIEIVRNSFDFSRFHEDWNIPIENSRLRYENWISDLFQQTVIIHIAVVGEKIVGVNIQKIDIESKKADLILCGCKKGAELYVIPLWNEIILFNKKQGINKISTLISASNINMANVYSFFDFKIKETLIGFHKKLNIYK